MKKILLVLFIAIFFMQVCLAAEDQSTEDIDKYFDEPEQEQAQAQPQSQEINGYIEYNQSAEQQQKEEDSIQLNPSSVTGINIAQPKSFKYESLVNGTKRDDFQPIQDRLEAGSKFSGLDYNIGSTGSSVSQQFGKFTVGTSYGSYLDSAQMNYSTSIFSKYDWKHFALSAGVSTTTSNTDDSDSHRFYIAPELKLTKRLSILDIAQADADQVNKKNEIVLRYTPHFKKYADDVQFEVGAGQSYYADEFVKSSLRFSTNFKL